MAHEIKPGDIVQLASGGQPMTVLTTGIVYSTVAWWSDTKQGISTTEIETVALILVNK